MDVRPSSDHLSKEVRMRKILLAGVAVLAIAGTTVVYAQHRHWFQEHMRINPEDRPALTDAGIAAVHAGLKLTPDQEKLWPPLESAVRDFAKLRMDRANARMNAKTNDRSDDQDGQKQDDPVARLRDRADNMTASGAALKKIADAADPLYKTLDEGQKRRLKVLTHIEHRADGEGWRPREFERDHDGGDRDRGYDRDGGQGWNRDRDHGGRSGPERL